MLNHSKITLYLNCYVQSLKILYLNIFYIYRNQRGIFIFWQIQPVSIILTFMASNQERSTLDFTSSDILITVYHVVYYIVYYRYIPSTIYPIVLGEYNGFPSDSSGMLATFRWNLDVKLDSLKVCLKIWRYSIVEMLYRNLCRSLSFDIKHTRSMPPCYAVCLEILGFTSKLMAL